MKRKLAMLLVLCICLSATLVVSGGVPTTTQVPEGYFQRVSFVDAEVTSSGLNVREGMSTEQKVICVLEKGAKVKVFGKLGEWYAIYVPGKNSVGVVGADYVKPITTVAVEAAPVSAVGKTATTDAKVVITDPKAGITDTKVSTSAAKVPTTDSKAAAAAAVADTSKTAVVTDKTTTKDTSAQTKAATAPAAPIVNTAGSSAKASTTAAKLDGTSLEEQKMLSLINKSRVDAGLNEVGFDMELMKTARIKAKDMADNNYFSNQSPTYGSPFDLMKKYGLSFKSAAEVIAGNKTEEAAFKALMGNNQHKANILNAKYGFVGIGIANDTKYGKIFVSEFVAR